ncbi:MAG: ribosomal protein S18-alanine N-acetyltransferase [Gammaproteobacteria bacterium]|nr:ribosomal protein S18-alanine N-acetyltransferase [Gammaproteobacteria bacterium]
MNITFEVFNEHNIEPIYLIETLAQSHPMSKKIMLSCLGKRYFNSAILVDGVIAGFYIGEFVMDESSLIEICIAPDFQGQGLGRQLLQHYIAQAKTKGADSCWLEVRSSNASARKLYQALDFNEVDCRVNYYPTEKGHEDAIIMSHFMGFC